MKKIALILGITGQDGSYLAELLLEKDYEVHGIIRRSSTFNTSRIDHLYNKIHLHYGDVTDTLSIEHIIQKTNPDEIYNLAAQSVSYDSLCPILSAQKISYRTLEELWNEQISKNKKVEIEKFNDIEIEVINLPENTQLKALGYMNGMGSWFKIKQISRHKFKGQIVEMSQKYGSIKITPNHSILDLNQKIRQPIENPWLLNVRKLNYFNRKSLKNIKVKVKGSYEYDKDYLWLNEKGNISKLKLNINYEYLPSFMRFLGAFITEGHTTYNKKTGNYYVGISEQNKEWLESLEKDLNNFFTGNICYIEHKKEGFKNVWELNIKSRILYNYLRENCGIDSHSKKIPDFVFQLENNLIQELFNKMLEGDGCYREDGLFRYTTSSYKLSCQLSLINTLLGYDYTVHESFSEKYGKSWSFRECNFYQYNQGESGKNIKYVDYDNYVYDISVDEVENFTVGVGNIVVHNSHVQVSFELPEYTGQVDALGMLRLIETVKNFNPNIKIYQASTSELFGKVQEIPQKETTPFYPRSPYGVAKQYAFWIAKNYREAYNMFICNGILFNHESERRGSTFVTKKITEALVKIKNGEQNVLKLGNLNSKRDWGYAKDYVYGMWLMLQQDKPDDYILATNETHTIKEFIEEAAPYVNMNIEWTGEGINEKGIDKNTGKIIIEVDKKYFRPAEVDLLLGDPSKAINILGWKPKVKFKELVKIMMLHDIETGGKSLIGT